MYLQEPKSMNFVEKRYATMIFLHFKMGELGISLRVWNEIQVIFLAWIVPLIQRKANLQVWMMLPTMAIAWNFDNGCNRHELHLRHIQLSVSWVQRAYWDRKLSWTISSVRRLLHVGVYIPKWEHKCSWNAISEPIPPTYDDYETSARWRTWSGKIGIFSCQLATR